MTTTSSLATSTASAVIASGSRAAIEELVNDPQSQIAYDGLLDSLVAVHEECQATALKRMKPVSLFTARFDEQIELVKEKRPKKSDFSIIKAIGRGAYGEVQLVRHKESQKLFALKILSKCEMLNKSESAFYWEERNIMAFAESPWIVKAHYAFQDAQYLYLAMEYMAGGDLVTVLEKLEYLPEDLARFYTAELVLALETLHGMGYIHRDVKPDNLLIGAQGHLKLADFGTCVRMDKDGLVQKPGSAVGTPDYISPEVLESQDGNGVYGKECDWWGLGVFLYELLCGGENPFYDDSLLKMYSKIQNFTPDQLTFPDEVTVSAEAQDLLKKLLVRSEHRLGRKDTSELKAHPFFNGIDWATLRETTPPYVPELKNSADHSNFPEIEPRQQPIQLFKSERNFTGNQLPFIGFTFARASHHDTKARLKLDASVVSEDGAVSSSSGAASAKIDQLTAQLDAAKAKLKAMSTECSQAKEKERSLQEKMESLIAEHTAEREKIVAINDVELKALNAKLTAATQRISGAEAAADARVEESERRLASEQLKTARLQEKIARQKEELESLTSACDDLKGQLVQAQRASDDSNTRSSTSADQNGEATAEAKLAAANKANARLQDELTELTEELVTTKRKLKQKATAFQEAQDEAEAAGERVKAILAEKTRVVAQLDTLQTSAIDSEETLSRKEEQLKAAKKKMSLLTIEIEELREKLTLVETEATNAKARPQNDTDEDASAVAELSVRVAGLQKEVAASKAERLSLLSQLEGAEDDLVEAREENKSLMLKLKDLRADMETTASEEVAALESQVRSLKSEHQRLDEELRDETSLKELLLGKISTLKTELEDKDAEMEHLVEEIDRVSSSAGQLRADAEKNAKASADKEKKLTEEIAALEKELEGVTSAREDAETIVTQLRGAIAEKTAAAATLTATLHEQEVAFEKQAVELRSDLGIVTGKMEDLAAKLAQKTKELASTTESSQKRIDLLLAGKSELEEEKQALIEKCSQLEEQLAHRSSEIQLLEAKLEESAHDLQLSETQRAQTMKALQMLQQGGAPYLASPSKTPSATREARKNAKIIRDCHAQNQKLERMLAHAQDDHRKKIGELNEEYGLLLQKQQEKISKLEDDNIARIESLEQEKEDLEAEVKQLKLALDKLQGDEDVSNALSPALKRQLTVATAGYEGWVSIPTGSKRAKWRDQYAVLDMEGLKLYEQEEDVGVTEPAVAIRIDEIHSAEAAHKTDGFHADTTSFPLIFKIKAVLIDRAGENREGTVLSLTADSSTASSPSTTSASSASTTTSSNPSSAVISANANRGDSALEGSLRRRSSSLSTKRPDVVRCCGHAFTRFAIKSSSNHFCRVCNKPLKSGFRKHYGMQCAHCGIAVHTKHFEHGQQLPVMHRCPGNITAKDYYFKTHSAADQRTWLSRIEQSTRKRADLNARRLAGPHSRLNLEVDADDDTALGSPISTSPPHTLSNRSGTSDTRDAPQPIKRTNITTKQSNI